MRKECSCVKCYHPECPPRNARPPYDEISHEIEDNVLSVKIPKGARKFHPERATDSRFRSDHDANCADSRGSKCRRGCTKVNVIPNQAPPPKTPEEETLSLRTIRQIMPNDDLRNTLEIEFKAPRNYIPLPDPGPPPPLITPKQSIKAKKGKPKSKGAKKK